MRLHYIDVFTHYIFFPTLPAYFVHVLQYVNELRWGFTIDSKGVVFTTTVWQDTVNKLRGKVKDAVKNKEKEKQLLIENIKSIKKQLKVGKYDIVYNKKCTHCTVELRIRFRMSASFFRIRHFFPRIRIKSFWIQKHTSVQYKYFAMLI